MKRGRSTGNKTKAQQIRSPAIRGIGRIASCRTRVMLEGVCAEFWNMAGQNRRTA